MPTKHVNGKPSRLLARRRERYSAAGAIDDGLVEYELLAATEWDDVSSYDGNEAWQDWDDYQHRNDEWEHEDWDDWDDWDDSDDDSGDEPYWSDLPRDHVVDGFLRGHLDPPEDVEFDHRWRVEDERASRICGCVACEMRREEDAVRREEDAAIDTRFPVGGERT